MIYFILFTFMILFFQLKFYGSCWNVTTLTNFTNIQIFNNFADFIFICVIETRNCVKFYLFNIKGTLIPI